MRTFKKTPSPYTVRVFFCYHAVMNTITSVEAHDVLQNGEAIVLDVRTAREYASGHIQNAQNIDFYGPGFENKIKKLDTEKSYVVNCLSGGRSGKTVALMESFGFKNVKNLVGGITAWKNQQLPVVTE